MANCLEASRVVALNSFLSPSVVRGSPCRLTVQTRRAVWLLLRAGTSDPAERDGDGPLKARLQSAEGDAGLLRKATEESALPALDFEAAGVEEIRREAERLAAKQAVERISNASYKELKKQAAGPSQAESAGFALKDAVDRLLVADFFFILLGLAWFLAGVLQQATTSDDGLLASWIKLWDPVFQPALGVFMGAAAISAASSWLAKRE